MEWFISWLVQWLRRWAEWSTEMQQQWRMFFWHKLPMYWYVSKSQRGRILSRDMDKKKICPWKQREEMLVWTRNKAPKPHGFVCLFVCFSPWPRKLHSLVSKFPSKRLSSLWISQHFLWKMLGGQVENQFWIPFVWYLEIQRKIWASGGYLHSSSIENTKDSEWEESLLW